MPWKHKSKDDKFYSGGDLLLYCFTQRGQEKWKKTIQRTQYSQASGLGLSFIGANNFADGLNPIVVGALITAIGFSLGGTTGFAINPARDFGPRLMHAILPIEGKGSSDWAYSWIPVIGPIIGGITGTLFYKALFNGVWNMSFWIFSILSMLILVYSVIYKKKE